MVTPARVIFTVPLVIESATLITVFTPDPVTVRLHISETKTDIAPVTSSLDTLTPVVSPVIVYSEPSNVRTGFSITGPTSTSVQLG